MSSSPPAKKRRRAADNGGDADDEASYTDSPTNHKQPGAVPPANPQLPQDTFAGGVSMEYFKRFEEVVINSLSDIFSTVHTLCERVEALEKSKDEALHAKVEGKSELVGTKSVATHDNKAQVSEHGEQLQNLADAETTAIDEIKMKVAEHDEKLKGLTDDFREIESLATHAVREIKDQVAPKVDHHGVRLDNLTAAVVNQRQMLTRHDTALAKKREPSSPRHEYEQHLQSRTSQVLDQAAALQTIPAVHESYPTSPPGLQEKTMGAEDTSKALKTHDGPKPTQAQSDCCLIRYHTLETEMAMALTKLDEVKREMTAVKDEIRVGSTHETGSKPALVLSNSDQATLRRLETNVATTSQRITPLEASVAALKKDVKQLSGGQQMDLLRAMDWRSTTDLERLKGLEDTYLHVQLFSEKDKCGGAAYTVSRATVNKWFYLIPRSRDKAWIPAPMNKPIWETYPFVVQLRPSGSRAGIGYYPQYVFEIGELFNRRVLPKEHGRQETHRSTGFHLVMDITKPEKPLWIVYRYTELAPDGESLKKTITYEHDAFWHPFGDVGRFDIAQVFEKVEDWNGVDTHVGAFATSKDLVARTAMRIKPEVYEPDVDKLKAAVEKGWSGPGKPSECQHAPDATSCIIRAVRAKGEHATVSPGRSTGRKKI
ncbi:hypothetical protein F4780DRAFT_667609 [Xylariomycetidae sp. FL0641]|nr:hypothetical protein F4780DRAFT_667609 [Xylariomycetidae sp. FL0641]